MFQCAKGAKKANQVLGQISRAISFRDKYTFCKLYKVYVRPHLQYCSSAWSPYTVADNEILENVQRRAVNMITNLTGTYEQKLATLGIYTLEESRIRGDMIEMYKLMSGKSKCEASKFFKLMPAREGARSTQSNTGYLNVEEPHLAKSDMRRNLLFYRCPRVWNSLPDAIKQVGTVNSFKAAYDAHVAESRV